MNSVIVVLLAAGVATAAKIPTSYPKGIETICEHYTADTDCSQVSSRFTTVKICDDNLQEHAHGCEFYKAACADDAKISLIYQKCNKTGQLYINTTRPTKHPYRVNPTHSPKVCRIVQEGCPKSWKVPNLMLCGNDRNIYRSRCEFDTAKCINPRLRLNWNLRSCLRNKPTKPPRVIDTTPAVPARRALNTWLCYHILREDCSKTLTAGVQVCDSNDKVYANSCEFYKVSCAGADIDDHWKVCKKTPEPAQLRPFVNKENLQFCQSLKEGKNCPRSWRKKTMSVCGSDGKLYKSRCSIEKAKCLPAIVTFTYLAKGEKCVKPTKPPIDGSGSGSGEGEVPVVEEARRDIDDWLCDYFPKTKDCKETLTANSKVCDADGKVYKNSCEFYKARCAGADIGDHWKVCKKTNPETLKPFVNKENSEFCKSLKAGEDCPKRWKQKVLRVCGSDGRVYKTRCAIEKAKCGDQLVSFTYAAKGVKCVKPTKPPVDGSGSGSGDEA
ncbi:uncharacterized protein LOC106159147 [Lingula anatina]|uniref:Uncharacterized protein LOC106159147 n=1 Tax=Lingula anatina TaxID=7574 RepID=A0A1S3HZ08_LINAN|nr:uncharacterized protein LOC106159147 [Lingula anatina]|eukprot:XP_013390806.1 uncharacterized protein LOC106159147 [Lingula anatina]